MHLEIISTCEGAYDSSLYLSHERAAAVPLSQRSRESGSLPRQMQEGRSGAFSTTKGLLRGLCPKGEGGAGVYPYAYH